MLELEDFGNNLSDLEGYLEDLEQIGLFYQKEKMHLMMLEFKNEKKNILLFIWIFLKSVSIHLWLN